MFFIHSTKIFIEIADNLGILNVLYMKIIIFMGLANFIQIYPGTGILLLMRSQHHICSIQKLNPYMYSISINNEL